MRLLGSARTPGRRIWVVRHGESTWNARGLMQRQVAHPPLTAKGIEQAYAAGFSLQHRGIGQVVTSDAVRARQTAAAMATVLEVPVIVDPRLRERDWLGAPGPAPAGSCPPQRLEDPRRRVAEALTALAGFGADSAVVTHGDIVCALLDMLSARNAETALWGDGLSVPNGAVVPMPIAHLRSAGGGAQP
ncbi:histidine phosphatase family protein [Mycolicibacterium frederiksbergense]|uniref:histidine phosphatase family protein n=1 Tax=Mycolicibacterium frederiksbergense TaxID=117567 RepID=UPI00265C0742|nr:histidine phosphatase family protein [Mycolicibacterium frederiksbergense]MDO0972627.1 histidine phosphatase family protein [Mycolicibacterium frederiksbergense]